MYLNFKLSVTIGSITTAGIVDGIPILIDETKKVLTISEINIKNDHSQLGSDCEIIFPLTVKVENKGQYLIDTPRNLFKSGDRIQIKCKYVGYTAELLVFDGFVYDFVEGSPLKMRCMDFAYLLRGGLVGKKLNKIDPITKEPEIGLTYVSGTITQVLNDILGNTGITLMENHLDFAIQNLSFINVSPYYCLEWIKKEMGITCTIIGQKLYFNLASNTQTNVRLQTNINVLTSGMQKPDGAFQKFKVQVNYKDVTGLKKAEEVGLENGETHTVNLYAIDKKTPKGQQDFNKLKDNSLENIKLGNYSGKITTYLYPNIELFDKIFYIDKRFPDRNGAYICRGYSIKIGKDGVHRELDLAFLRELLPNEAIPYQNTGDSYIAPITA